MPPAPAANETGSPEESGSLEEMIFTPEQWAALAKSVPLTPRETEIAQMVLQSKKHKEIAQILGCDPRTVRTHLSRVFAKLQINSKQGIAPRLICILRQHNLLS